MALSLLKLTVNNPSGTYSPNLTLWGLFDVNVFDNEVEFAYPVGVGSNGQHFSIALRYTAGATNGLVTFSDDYVFAPMYEIAPTWPNPFTTPASRLVLGCLAADGKVYVQSINFHNPPA